MTKHELIEMTLDQLLDEFKAFPESFVYGDREHTTNPTYYPTITWQPKIELDNSVVCDPNDTGRIVTVSYDLKSRVFRCDLFSSVTKAGASISTDRRLFETWRANHKKFFKLARFIKKHGQDKEGRNFLKKLCDVFPSTLDEHLLGK